MRVVVTEALRELARTHRIFSPTADRLWPLGATLVVGRDAIIEPYTHLLGGFLVPARFGAFTYSHSAFDIHTRIGRYGSIAWGVKLMGSAHPHQWAAMHPFSHNPGPLPGLGAYLADVGAAPLEPFAFAQRPAAVMIGHDVWIGNEASLQRNITIGHGAVIGAQAVVTRDVPPYAIVAGSPARVIRYRFEESLIEDLLASEWWRYGPDVLQALDVRDPAGFLDRLREREARGDVSPMDLTPLTGEAILQACAAD